MVPLPLRETALSCPIVAEAARVPMTPSDAASIVTAYGIGKDDMATVYMSPDPFFDAFEEDLDLCKWSFDKHHTASLSLLHHNGCLYLGGMTPSSPGAKVDKWRLNLRSAWLIKIGSSTASKIAEAHAIFKDLYDRGTPLVTLLFLHPEIRQYISNKGLPIVSSAHFLSRHTTNSTIIGISLPLPSIFVKLRLIKL
jgi:hypothetical protein